MAAISKAGKWLQQQQQQWLREEEEEERLASPSGGLAAGGFPAEHHNFQAKLLRVIRVFPLQTRAPNHTIGRHLIDSSAQIANRVPLS